MKKEFKSNCICGVCGKVFYRKPSQKARAKETWCSIKCITSPEPRDRMIARFWKNVTKTDTCWLYANSLKHHPFWRKKVDGGQIGAHKFSYLIHYGEVPDSEVVRHTCDVGGCVRPDHLISGTYAENSNDAVERNRLACGERQWNARLSELQVKEIRKRFDSGDSQSKLAREFNVTPANIRAIVTGRTWKHLVLSETLDK